MDELNVNTLFFNLLSSWTCNCVGSGVSDTSGLLLVDRLNSGCPLGPPITKVIKNVAVFIYLVSGQKNLFWKFSRQEIYSVKCLNVVSWLRSV